MANHPQLNKQSLENIDPFQESMNCLIVIVFPKSSSKNFEFALNLAQGASKYNITEISGKHMHFAAFSKNQADAGRAMALLEYISSWKGTMLFSGGKLIQTGWHVSQVIGCYLESCSCRDSKAHCNTIIDDPFINTVQNMSMSISILARPALKKELKIDRYAFPCKYLYSYYRFEKDHPSSPQDQIQAAAVSKGCDICPHFNPDDFKIVGSRTILKDFFE